MIQGYLRPFRTFVILQCLSYRLHARTTETRKGMFGYSPSISQRDIKMPTLVRLAMHQQILTHFKLTMFFASRSHDDTLLPILPGDILLLPDTCSSPCRTVGILCSRITPGGNHWGPSIRGRLRSMCAQSPCWRHLCLCWRRCCLYRCRGGRRSLT